MTEQSERLLQLLEPVTKGLRDLDLSDPAAAVLKHNNPCGCAIGPSLAEAFDKAYAGDPVSAFGSIISFNRELDLATAELLARPGQHFNIGYAKPFEQGMQLAKQLGVFGWKLTREEYGFRLVGVVTAADSN